MKLHRLAAAGAALAVSLATVVATASPSDAAQTRGISGLWRSDGYGMLVSIHDGQLQTYEITAVSCMPSFSATQTAPADADGSVRFGVRGVPELTVWPASDAAPARVRLDGTVADYHLLPVSGLPSACSHPVPNDPVSVFDVFWATYAENYPFFAAKGVNWQAVRERYRPLVGPNTTPDQLFTILTDMIKPLGDAHTAITADASHAYWGLRPGTPLPTPQFLDQVNTQITQDVPAGLRTWANGHIGYADLPNHVGYLRITQFSDYVDSPNFADSVAVLDDALNAVFTPARTAGPQALHGLIIDLRVNLGGSDALGVRIASRLTDRTYLAYAKQTRNDPHNPRRFTSPLPVWVQPDNAPRYTGPLTVLTGPDTFSAGETFTQALLDRAPTSVRIGENTQGVFSDILGRSLPNGWQFGLPNERYLTRTGMTFDGAGIPPQIRVPVFTDSDLAAHRDPAFDRAVSLLTQE